LPVNIKYMKKVKYNYINELEDALNAIECLAMCDNKKSFGKIIDKIYMIAHSERQDAKCYKNHSDWREIKYRVIEEYKDL
jgi:hypothetical protein